MHQELLGNVRRQESSVVGKSLWFARISGSNGRAEPCNFFIRSRTFIFGKMAVTLLY